MNYSGSGNSNSWNTGKGYIVDEKYLYQTIGHYHNKTDVEYIVTEYGIAQLKGKTMIQRARELIKIAHPKFTAQLEEDFAKRFGRVKAVM
ncbi:MAG: acetyl-CoA hydrolase/transferase C-terminal domain-containing protein [Syntrophomonadaceae bacterium]|nr:acetyl-CoA hydrolase/transferase C-terminal domain-containing protein [Syntrophomonadaceae bacterium]